MRLLITLFFSCYLLLATCYCSAYVFGLKSFDNSLTNIREIEATHNLNIPMVAIVLDPYKLQETIYHYQGIEFMSGKVFHFTVSPGHMSAKQVSQGKFDAEYREFFEFVKEKKIKVIFRTMHEMNGNRYPRSGTPYRYKKARKRVWNLSRKVGLDQSQILFDFSLNHRDKVTLNGKSTRCFLGDQRVGCKTWEDYYPGDNFVDILGFTFYNRGKATSDRSWLRPQQILVDDGAGLLERLASKQKPVIIDEVATTKVRYTDQRFDFARSQEVFRNDNHHYKNLWLRRLAQFIKKQDMIKGMVYFNIDYTAGLNYEIPNEADRAVIDLTIPRYYSGVNTLLESGEGISVLKDLFVPSLLR